ncbi:restriction endonuclease [Vibrio sp. S9_S30]|uniref:PmeII family type II restriction endonuclease n=1 Tax=Vibrio sp. S9_S30 TaxID=2720226 RepID=UPI0016806B90|nr:PmeII family type II restriction endonuclease [Vibrio sp. S9_S30]MBD1558510.1 restriction endonuclease [Vibrio sp. S9_S30]
MKKEHLLSQITEYFEQKIFLNHKEKSLKQNARLKSYNINPIVVRYLSKVLADDFTPIGVAKALYYPRVLGTSINTSFGDRIQKMFVELKLAEGSLIKGMDIEFEDRIDGRKKWCQLKSGPNTINSEDVKPLLKKFTAVTNLARTNSMLLNNNDLIMGVLYGTAGELSQHYMTINEQYPVIVGQEFWHRLTGYEEFYHELVAELDTLIFSLPTDDFLNEGCLSLAKEIEESGMLNGG